MSTNIPSLQNCLNQWWGAGDNGGAPWWNSYAAAAAGIATNLVFGGGPLYQIEDFLAFYPQFGTYTAGLVTVGIAPNYTGLGYSVGDTLNVVQQDATGGTVEVTSVGALGVITGLAVVTPGQGYQLTLGTGAVGVVTLAAGGAGYAVADVVTLVQTGASGATVQVTTVNGNGAITGFMLAAPGAGYVVEGGIPVTGGKGTGAEFNITATASPIAAPTSGGTGSGAQVLITALTAYTSSIPQPVLQTYVNLAAASLQYARWLDMWPLAMALYIAHFCTLYLQSSGSVNASSPAAAVASAGLQQGLIASQAAGDVSESKQFITGWEQWGSFELTAFGLQLVTFAASVGAGPMYIL